MPRFFRDESTSGGKMPHYGPRRLVRPQKNREVYVDPRPKFNVSSTDVSTYHAICSLASSRWKDEHAVDIGGVHCTFQTFGESFRPDSQVSNFVVAVFCRHLFMKHNGHPETSKRHFFFSNIGENLMKDPEEANYDVLQRAFKLSSKARPLHKSDMLFFPILFENHWFVFVVDIKDRRYVFLDSLHNSDDPYQQHVRNVL
ncbi:hypothetical protein EJB05_00457, partial [Eragrostis curvula]